MIAAVQLASAGYRLPYDALVDLILDCRDRNVSVASVSIYLAGFDMDITAGRKFRKKSGPDKSEYIMRDLCIGYVVFLSATDLASNQLGIRRRGEGRRHVRLSPRHWSLKAFCS
jgi:hypothetical protein